MMELTPYTPIYVTQHIKINGEIETFNIRLENLATFASELALELLNEDFEIYGAAQNDCQTYFEGADITILKDMLGETRP